MASSTSQRSIAMRNEREPDVKREKNQHKNERKRRKESGKKETKKEPARTDGLVLLLWPLFVS